MDDFFSNLARQVLGAAPEVGPLLPPRFASWPGLPLADVALRPQDLADTPARADAADFPTPLIDPDGPAANAPLPTFRQMRELRSAPGPPLQPGRTPVAQGRPETADSEQGDVRRDGATPVRSAMGDALPNVPLPAFPSSPAPPASVIQTEAEGGTDGGVTAAPAPRGASGDRPSEEMATTQRDRVVPHPSRLTPASTLQPAPRPVAGQERSTYSAGLPDSPADVRRLPRSGQAEPVKTEPLETELIEAKRPRPVTAQSQLVPGHTDSVEAQPELVESQTEPIELWPEPVRASRPEFVEARPRPVKAQPELVPGNTEPVEVQLELVESRTEPVELHPEPVKARTDPITSRAELVEARPKPAEARSELLEARPEPASATLTVQPAVSVPAPVTQRQAVSGDQPVAPLESRPVPATDPDLPVSTQGRATPATPVLDVTTGSLEPAPPAGRAVPGWREPVIVPALEAAPGEMWPTTRAEMRVSLPPASARSTTGEPEPATTVRVTIGRVIVWAGPTAERPPSRRIELPRPPLALEEYLRGRQGDER